MLSWVQISHNGYAYVVTTYLDNTRVSEIVTADLPPVMIELNQRLNLLKGLARGKCLTSQSGNH